ncbi:MAG TPA: hypothetical protein VJG32_20560 [Anaerolineae bacterium]|nr:hypothetical protein [Anaerolineae bacterium]
MLATSDNPPITPWLRLITFIEVLVLLGAGLGLFFAPELIRPQWPWSPAPFNTRFLGATYLASLVTVIMLALGARWAPARVVLPALFGFTLIVLIVSLLNLNQFDFGRWSTVVIWFPLYSVLPLSAAYHLWLYRKLPPADPTPTPAGWRAYLSIVALGLGLYSVGLLVAPATFSAFWPWPIDAFHAQMYSAAFASGAIGAFMVSRVAARSEWLIAALAQGVFGLFAILGVLLVDASTQRVDYRQPGAWLWLGAFAGMTVASLGMLWQARYRRAPA